MSIMLLSQNKNLAKSISLIYGLWNTKSYLGGTCEGQLKDLNLNTFIKDLYAMNHACYCKRYNTTESNTHKQDVSMSKFQTLKTLQCLRYNIEDEYLKDFQVSVYNNYFKELNEIKTVDDILKVLDILIDEIKDNILRNLPEYDNAIWG